MKDFLFENNNTLVHHFDKYPVFRITPFYKYDIRGKNLYDVLAYEISEMFDTNEVVKKPFGSCAEIKCFVALQFKTWHEARFFLELFAWLLNYDENEFDNSPELQACRREISKQITNMLVNAPHDEIEERHRAREEVLKRVREAASPELTRIYAMHFDNNCTKIGISKDVYHRMNVLETPPLIIDSFAYTEKTFTFERAREIESECHRHFSAKNRCLEYFNISLDEACQKLQEYSELYISTERRPCTQLN